MKLSVIIPARNEAGTIGTTLEKAYQYLSQQSYDWEILVVNNNSTDNMAEVVEKYARAIPQIRLLHEKKVGKGQAVISGMRNAQGDLRLFMDADSSTTIDHVERMIPFIEKGFDVVIGSLAVPGASVAKRGREPFWRVMLGKMGNKWIQIFAVWGINDTQRGFKLFTERAAKAIFPQLTIFKWGFDIEVLAIAKICGFKIKEIPVVKWNNGAVSRVTIWSYLEVLMETLKVFRNKVAGRYKKV